MTGLKSRLLILRRKASKAKSRTSMLLRTNGLSARSRSALTPYERVWAQRRLCAQFSHQSFYVAFMRSYRPRCHYSENSRRASLGFLATRLIRSGAPVLSWKLSFHPVVLLSDWRSEVCSSWRDWWYGAEFTIPRTTNFFTAFFNSFTFSGERAELACIRVPAEVYIPLSRSVRSASNPNAPENATYRPDSFLAHWSGQIDEVAGMRHENITVLLRFLVDWLGAFNNEYVNGVPGPRIRYFRWSEEEHPVMIYPPDFRPGNGDDNQHDGNPPRPPDPTDDAAGRALMRSRKPLLMLIMLVIVSPMAGTTNPWLDPLSQAFLMPV